MENLCSTKQHCAVLYSALLRMLHARCVRAPPFQGSSFQTWFTGYHLSIKSELTCQPSPVRHRPSYQTCAMCCVLCGVCAVYFVPCAVCAVCAVAACNAALCAARCMRFAARCACCALCVLRVVRAPCCVCCAALAHQGNAADAGYVDDLPRSPSPSSDLAPNNQTVVSQLYAFHFSASSEPSVRHPAANQPPSLNRLEPSISSHASSVSRPSATTQLSKQSYSCHAGVTQPFLRHHSALSPPSLSPFSAITQPF
jgi:hypothetical protein